MTHELKTFFIIINHSQIQLTMDRFVGCINIQPASFSLVAHKPDILHSGLPGYSSIPSFAISPQNTSQRTFTYCQSTLFLNTYPLLQVSTDFFDNVDRRSNPITISEQRLMANEISTSMISSAFRCSLAHRWIIWLVSESQFDNESSHRTFVKAFTFYPYFSPHEIYKSDFHNLR